MIECFVFQRPGTASEAGPKPWSVHRRTEVGLVELDHHMTVPDFRPWIEGWGLLHGLVVKTIETSEPDFRLVPGLKSLTRMVVTVEFSPLAT